MNNREDIWVYGENYNGEIAPVVFELINKACELRNIKARGKVCVILIGSNINNSALKLARSGCDKVYKLESPVFKDYDTICYSKAIIEKVLEYDPSIFLLGATYQGRDLAPRVAAGLKTGLTADCVDLKIDPENGILKQIVPGFGGRVFSNIICPVRRPQMSTVRPGVISAATRELNEKVCLSQTAEIISLGVSTECGVRSYRITGKKNIQGGCLKLSEARIICAGGRGLKTKENFELLEEFASAIGASVGATRAATDDGLCDERLMIGQTGTVVRPEVYFAFGISGAVQHVIGVRNCRLLVAVNEDYLAPIFDIADFALIGDARKFLEDMLKRKEEVLRVIQKKLG